MRFVGTCYRAHDPRWAFKPMSGEGAANRGARFDCEDVADLTTERGRRDHSVELDEMSCAWATALANGDRPASWSVYDRLKAQGAAGILVPSFAPGAEADDLNLVLWQWGPDLPHKVTVFDPSGRLPKDQLSWR